MEECPMLWGIFVLGLIVIVGGVLFGFAFGIALTLFFLALKILIVGAIAYFIIRLVSPRTAAALRAKFCGPAMPRF
jgi:hypothetical protein